MITIPPYLKKGDTIGIVAPSGFMPAEKAETCITTLETWGYKVKVGSTVGNQFHYFSGTDKERIADLQKMLNDTTIKAILCARGGYGLSRMIDDLDFQKFKKHPKWIIGFSDVTVLHAHIFQHYQIATMHAPMAGAFNGDGHKNKYIASLKDALSGVVANYECAAHAFNKTGHAEAELIGGNLAIVAHLIGSHSSYKTRHKILFLEDVGEYLYNIDRMLIQLERAEIFKHLKGLIIGGFSEMKDTTIPFGKDVYSIINDRVKDLKIPICFGFPVSHDTENLALKIGVQHELIVAKDKVKLKEVW
ncbi:MAG: LD-carboxypeptidase [Bacteroidota bacterium]|nr:LD-carboxypeptidase [Bacteroidota bacterium]